MTPKPIFLLSLLACALLPGCTVCQNAKRTILNEPSDFSWMADRKLSIEVYRSWADRAWSEQCSIEPGQRDSHAYVAGFKDGFVDHVFAGGSGEPPPVPPRQFWNVEVRNPRGQSEATDWFAGFRHGASVAREEGHRERALVPSSLFLFGPREDCWGDEPCYSGPSSDVMAEPLLPEFVPPGQLAPEAGTKVFESEMPTLATPNAEMPSVDGPANESIPAAEKLPQPQLVPDAGHLPQQPETPRQSAPKQSPPKSDRPSSDVDDIFGSTAPDSDALEPQVQRKKKFKKVLYQDVAVQQARAAFASAIRTREATATTPSAVRLLNSDDHSSSSHYMPAETPTERAAIPLPRARSAVSPIPRTATIPRSEDRAEEMFRRLSQ